MENVQSIIDLVLKAVAVGMAVAAIVLGALGGVSVGTKVSLLAIGVFALALVALRSRSI